MGDERAILFHWKEKHKFFEIDWNMATFHLSQNFQQLMEENIYIVRKYLRQKYFLLIMHVRQVHNDNELDYFWQCSCRNNGWNVSCLCNNTLINDMPQFMFKSPQISVLFCPNDAWSWITTCLTLQHNTGTWNNCHLSERSLEYMTEYYSALQWYCGPTLNKLI